MSPECKSSRWRRVASAAWAPITTASLAVTPFIVFDLLRAFRNPLGAGSAIEATICAIAALSSWALLALVFAPLVFAARLLWRLTRADSDAFGPLTRQPFVLLLLVALGSGIVVANRHTFAGAGLARSGLSTIVEVTALTFALFALYSIVLISTRAYRTRATQRRRLVVATSLTLVAVLFSIADRTLFLGQYPAVHWQLRLGALFAFAVAAALIRHGRPTRLRSCGAVIAGAALGACALLALPPATSPLAALSRRADLGASRLVDLFASVLPRPDFLGDLPQVDPAPLFVDPPFDSAAARRALAQGTKARTPSLVIISLDTVRWDHVSFMGHERRTTPNWDAAANRSLVFERAYTNYPTSSYAYSAMLTSRWAEECPQRVGPDLESVVSLPGLLGARGWATHAVTAFVPSQVAEGGPFSTFDDGFDEFEAIARPDADADTVATRAITVLEELARSDDPFFLWVQFFDPHHPYTAHDDHSFGQRDVDRYDSEIAFTDAALGRLLAALDESPAAGTIVTVIHSDHGEAFGEHGTEYHNSSIYEEQIRIPLTIGIPGQTHRRIAEIVSLVDLLPTITTLFHVEDPDRHRRRGRDLAGLLTGIRPEYAGGVAFSQLLLGPWLPSRTQHALITSIGKIVHVPRGLDPWLLFDLDEDPAETRNVFGRDRRRTALLVSGVKLVEEKIGRR